MWFHFVVVVAVCFQFYRFSGHKFLSLSWFCQDCEADVNAWNKEQLDVELNKCDSHQRVSCAVKFWSYSMIQHWGLCVLQLIWTGDAHKLLIWHICTEKRLICPKERCFGYISHFTRPLHLKNLGSEKVQLWRKRQVTIKARGKSTGRSCQLRCDGGAFRQIL